MSIILKNLQRKGHHFTVWLYGDRKDDVGRTLFLDVAALQTCCSRNRSATPQGCQ